MLGHHFLRPAAIHHRPGTRHFSVLLFVLLALTLLAAPARATQPPRPGEIEQYRRDGTLPARLAFGRKLANHRFRPELIQRQQMILRAQQSGTPVSQAALPYPPGLPSKGTPRIFALLIDFSDYPHTNADTVFANKLFGVGDDAERPYESLRSYYKRAAYNQLDIQGDVMPWYRAKYERSMYFKASSLIKEALENYKNSYDFTKYDSNGDGKIDFFMVFWTGPDTGWNTFWWAWCDMDGGTFASDSYTIDGKRLGAFCWQWEANPVGSTFQPRTAIHETGHGLGLPDLYDYDGSIGPQGGCGGLDMMDHNWGDHNAFSKWLLGWLTPKVVSATGPLQSFTLRPSALYGDAVMVMPGAAVTQPFSEFFLVQNRSRREKTNSNDFDIPGDGLCVWHIDATLDGTGKNFFNDNSYTSHKLVRLMEADAMEHIEQDGDAEQADFYTNAGYFSPASTPGSKSYSGTRTGVSVLNINKALLLLPGTPASTYYANIGISAQNLVGVAEAVDNTSLNWDLGGSASGLFWYGQKATSFFGGDAVQNTPLGNGQYVSLGTRVNGPLSLRFYWKVSSQAGDNLEFYIDNVKQAAISGERNWEQKAYTLTAGSHYLSWKYAKDAAGAAGSDSAWIDKIEASSVSLAEALDNSLLTYSHSGTTPWFGEEPVYYYGGSAAQSGQVGDSQLSMFYTTVTGPATVTYSWKVSSEANGDYLEFFDNAASKAKISGETDWQSVTYSVSAGQHTLAWQYKKNASGVAGDDCGWVDMLCLSETTLAEALDTTGKPYAWLNKTTNKWLPITTNLRDRPDYARSTLNASGQKAILQTSVMGPGTIKFWWKEDTAGNGGDMAFKIDGVNNGWAYNNDWTQKTVSLSEGMHLLSWEYEFIGSSGSDFACVDQFEFIPSWLTLADALDNASYSWETYGAGQWFAQQTITNFGVDAAQSGPIGADQNCFLDSVVYGPGQLSFDWKVSSLANVGILEFYFDDRFIAKISGEVNWQRNTVLVRPGSHPVRWLYWKNGAGAAGKDSAWLDHVAFTPAPSLGQALDTSNPVWSDEGEGSIPWMGQTITAYSGGDAAISGNISGRQASTMSAAFTGPGNISFFWKVSSQHYWDWLEFQIDGARQTRISGEVDWQKKTFWLGKGTHTVTWRYSKDNAFNDGQDCGWIDKVQFQSLPNAATDPLWTVYE